MILGLTLGLGLFAILFIGFLVYKRCKHVKDLKYTD